MRFPLADWIMAHPDCRFDLASSGMRGAIPPPPWPARRPPIEVVEELQLELARHLHVAAERLFLSHGASEANAWVLGFFARELGRRGRSLDLRVRFPEYPPLFDVGRALGFRLRKGAGTADVAAVSRPRNPEGDLWSEEELARFADGSRHLLVDETFREFARVPSVAVAGAPRLWTTGSFTKFFGADEVRVGFAVAPPEAEEGFARYVGLVSDEIAPGSAAVALELLRNVRSIRAAVDAVLERNRRAFASGFPGVPLPAAPVHFDRLRRESGCHLAERCVASSVLVCPGTFFGDPRGVRVCLTGRHFPQALRAYLAIRQLGEPLLPPVPRRSGLSTAP